MYPKNPIIPSNIIPPMTEIAIIHPSLDDGFGGGAIGVMNPSTSTPENSPL